MNNHDPNQLRTQLQQLGLLATMENDSITDNHGESNNVKSDSTPWFIHLFFGFSGLVSSLFLVGFLTLLLTQIGIFEHAGLQLIIGIVLSAVAFIAFTNKKTQHNTFWQSVALALSAAGQLYIAFAIFSSEFETPLDTWLLLLFQILTTIIMPNFIYKLCSSTIALGCVAYLLGNYQVPELILGTLALIMTVANLQRCSLVQRLPNTWRMVAMDITHALTYTSALLLIAFSVYIVQAEYSRDFVSNMFSYNYILAQGLLILASLYATYLILKRYRIAPLTKPSLIIMSIVIILGILSVYVSGLLATSLVIIIAFANSQRVLLGLGIVSLVGYIFWYYYQLDTSLLIKSGSMLIIGLVILLLRELLKRLSAPKAVNL